MVEHETKNICDNQGEKNRESSYQVDSSPKTLSKEKKNAKIETDCHERS